MSIRLQDIVTAVHSAAYRSSEPKANLLFIEARIVFNLAIRQKARVPALPTINQNLFARISYRLSDVWTFGQRLHARRPCRQRILRDSGFGWLGLFNCRNRLRQRCLTGFRLWIGSNDRAWRRIYNRLNSRSGSRFRSSRWLNGCRLRHTTTGAALTDHRLINRRKMPFKISNLIGDIATRKRGHRKPKQNNAHGVIGARIALLLRGSGKSSGDALSLFAQFNARVWLVCILANIGRRNRFRRLSACAYD